MTLGLPVAVPVKPSREHARSLLNSERAKPEYHTDDPGLVQRALSWLWHELLDLLDRAAGATPGGATGVLVLAVVAVLAIVAIRVTVGPIARAGRMQQPLFTGRARSAAEHRRTADEHASAGQWADAVRERLRAIVRGLEERGLLDERLGRTADEAAAEAGALLPRSRDGLRRAAVVFDEVWYGGRVATPEHDELLRSVDDEVRSAQPSHQSEAPYATTDFGRFGPPE
jgi:uncharacterized protein DUF4129